MPKKLAIGLVVVLLAIVAWALLYESNSFSITVNGQPVTGPLKGAIGAGGFLAALVSALCAAIILLFVFAGAGAVVLGILVVVGLGLSLVMFPFTLPVLIPLAIVWLFVAIARRGGQP